MRTSTVSPAALQIRDLSPLAAIQPTTYFSGIKQRGLNIVPFTDAQLAQLQDPPQLAALDASDSHPFYPQFYCK
jgi:hypothetical protein